MLKGMTRAVLDYYVQFVQKFNKLRQVLFGEKTKVEIVCFSFFLSSSFFFKVTQYLTKASQVLKTYKVVLQLTYVGHLTGVICQLCSVFSFLFFFSLCVFFSFPVVQSVTQRPLLFIAAHVVLHSSDGDFSSTYIRDSVWLIDVISYQVNSYHNVAYTVCATATLQLGFSQQCQ